jgi:hypothetical protein
MASSAWIWAEEGPGDGSGDGCAARSAGVTGIRAEEAAAGEAAAGEAAAGEAATGEATAGGATAGGAAAMLPASAPAPSSSSASTILSSSEFSLIGGSFFRAEVAFALSSSPCSSSVSSSSCEISLSLEFGDFWALLAAPAAATEASCLGFLEDLGRAESSSSSLESSALFAFGASLFRVLFFFESTSALSDFDALLLRR